MTEQQQPAVVNIVPPSATEPLTVVRMPRQVEMYYVTGQELEALASGNASIHVAFFGITFGACVTLLVTLSTIPLTDRQNAAFVTLSAGAVLACVYFGIRALIDHRRQRRLATDIKHSRSA